MVPYKSLMPQSGWKNWPRDFFNLSLSMKFLTADEDGWNG